MVAARSNCCRMGVELRSNRGLILVVTTALKHQSRTCGRCARDVTPVRGQRSSRVCGVSAARTVPPGHGRTSPAPRGTSTSCRRRRSRRRRSRPTRHRRRSTSSRRRVPADTRRPVSGRRESCSLLQDAPTDSVITESSVKGVMAFSRAHASAKTAKTEKS